MLDVDVLTGNSQVGIEEKRTKRRDDLQLNAPCAGAAPSSLWDQASLLINGGRLIRDPSAPRAPGISQAPPSSLTSSRLGLSEQREWNRVLVTALFEENSLKPPQTQALSNLHLPTAGANITFHKLMGGSKTSLTGAKEAKNSTGC